MLKYLAKCYVSTYTHSQCQCPTAGFFFVTLCFGEPIWCLEPTDLMTFTRFHFLSTNIFPPFYKHFLWSQNL